MDTLACCGAQRVMFYFYLLVGEFAYSILIASIKLKKKKKKKKKKHDLKWTLQSLNLEAPLVLNYDDQTTLKTIANSEDPDATALYYLFCDRQCL